MKKTTFSLISIFIILSAYLLMSQDCFASQWARTYDESSMDQAVSIRQTADACYIVAGSIWGGTYDMWILKLDSDGTVSWQKTYGGSNDDGAESIQQATDGGYVVAGFTHSFGFENSPDIWILKLDQAGTISWQKTYGGDNADYAHTSQQTADGGYIVAGRTYSFGAGRYDFWILKLDSNGNVIWQKTYGGSGNDYAYSIQQTNDGGYIVAGLTYSFGAGTYDIWVLKLDAVGNVSWQKTYGGSGGDHANSIQQTPDGGYIVAGYTDSFGAGWEDMWILKLDSTGNISWQRTYGGSNGDFADYIRQTRDGGYIVGGTTGSFGAGDRDGWVLKLDSIGNISWQKTYGGSEGDYVYSFQQTTDGSYIVAGETASFGPGRDYWILKLDSNGNVNNCDSIGTSAATITDTTISGVTSSASISIPSLTIADSTVISQDTSAEVEEQCFAPDWFPTEPPSQNKLNGVWGYLSDDSKHEFYAVGKNGTIIHFDGTNWTGTGSPTLYDLHGVWGSSETDIYAVGEYGTIVHYPDEYGEWENVTHSLPTNTLYDVWGSSSSDVYAVGDGGKIAHYDGTDWSEETSPTTDNLRSIWGSSASDYHAVGEGGRIIRYNGSWSTVTSPTSNDLNDVWGSASDDIYAVGKLGTIIHYDGTSWSNITDSPTSANLRGIWGSSEENIFAVGEHGTILYYDGESWQKMDSGSQDSLVSTFGTLNPLIMVVGYDGNILSLGGPSLQGKICNACTGEAIDEVTVEFDRYGEEYQTAQTGPEGIYPPIPSQGGAYPLLFEADGYMQQEMTVDLPNNSSIVDHATYLLPVYPDYEDCITGMITKTVLIGVGIQKENKRGVQNMEVKLYQGSTEIQSTVTDVGGNYHFTGLSPGTYRVEPVITSSECTTTPSEYTYISVPTISRHDFELSCPSNPPSAVAYWSEMTSGTDNLLHGIWGSSATDIFAVGDAGVIVHYNGTNWSDMTSNTTKNLKGVWGSLGTDVYAAGEEGVIIHYDGTNWSNMTSNTPNGLNAIWGSSGMDIFSVGDSSTIVHYDGTEWESMTSGTTVKLLSVWGSSSSDVYAMGNSHKDSYWRRTIIHYNGTMWEEVDTGNGVTLMSSWGSSVNDITATGSFGGIMRYNGIEWQQIGGPTERTLNAMWGASSDNIFAVGFKGVIAHYDGTDWSVRKPGDEDDQHDLYGIWGNSETEVYAVGDKGTILVYTGDIDGDGEPDDTDNCPEVANHGQENDDGDTLGNACDNCPNDDNEDQANSDYDEYGNACDNCWGVSNPYQLDTDGDCPDPPYSSDPQCGNACEVGEDSDEDGWPDSQDNCPNTPNGPDLGTCINCGNPASIGPPCTSDIGQCENGFCSMNQEDYDGNNVGDVCEADISGDTYPPGGNECVDICECEADFDGDTAVGANDVTTFLDDFGRSQYNQPCSICIIGSGMPPTNFCRADVDCGEGGECGPDPGNTCNGDFDCDGAVASNDVTKFLEDFGRNQYNNPCPQNCQTGDWCSY